MPGISWEWLASRLWKRPASWSPSGEAWVSPSDPRCLTGFQRSRNINLALNLSGSAFRVKSTAEPTPVGEPTESVPEPAPFRESTESAPDPAPFREPTESAPDPAPFREPTESAPDPALFCEPTESAPESVPWAHRVRSVSPFRSVSPQSPLQCPIRSVSQRSPPRSGSPHSPLRSGSPHSPFRSGSPQSLLCSGSPQSLLCSGSPQSLLQNGNTQEVTPLKCGSLLHPGCLLLCLPCLGLLLCLPHPGTRGCLCPQALFHYMGLASHPSPAQLLPLLDDWERLEAIPLRGDYVISPPEVAISLPPGLISLLSIHLSLITPSAVPHYHCLYIPFSLTTLPAISYSCMIVVNVESSVPCSLGHQHCVAVCGVPFSILFLFFALLAFLFIK